MSLTTVKEGVNLEKMKTTFILTILHLRSHLMCSLLATFIIQKLIEIYKVLKEITDQWKIH